jgi:TonB family protein
MVCWQGHDAGHKLQALPVVLRALALFLVLAGLPAAFAQVAPAKAPIRVSSKEADEHLQVKTLQPEYPSEAKARSIEGTVRVQIGINERGNITDARALSGDPLLIPSAIALVKRFPYRPFVRDGKRVAVTTEVAVPFVLHPVTPKEIYDSWQQHLETARQLRKDVSVEAALGELNLALADAKKLGDMDVAETYDDIAGLYFKEGRYSEAEPALERRLDILQHSQIQDELEIANTQADLAAAYLVQNKLTKVQELLQRAILVQQEYLRHATLQDSKDAYSIRLAHSVRSLAMFYDLQGRPSTAEPLYKQSISLGEQRLPPDDEALTMRRYAEMLARIGRSDEAAKLMDGATALQLGISK